MRPAASKLAKDTNLSHFQPFYDAEGKRQPADIHEVEELVRPIRKHTYAPDINPSDLIHEEAVLQALTGIDWSTADFQRLGRDEEVRTPTDPQRQTVVMKSPNPVAGLHGYCEKQWHCLSHFEASCNRIAETLFICHAIEHVS